MKSETNGRGGTAWRGKGSSLWLDWSVQTCTGKVYTHYHDKVN